MTAAARREAAAVQVALEQWLRARPGYATARIGQPERPFGAGLSNETWLFDCQRDSSCESLVLQVGPAGPALFHRYDLPTMARVQQRLGELGRVPVPRIRWVEEDPRVLGAAFYVMDRVPGRVPSDNPSYHAAGWFRELPASAQKACWYSAVEAMAVLHQFDPARDGFDFLTAAPWGMPSNADPGRTRLAQWRNFLRWGARRALPEIERALDALERRCPPSTRPRVHWGDAKISNCVLAEDRVQALLDWELCGLSDPQEDLAFFVLLDWAQWRSLGIDRLPHLPSPRETVAHYEAQVGAVQRHVAWWFAFGLVRLAIIYHRFIERRIDAGRLQADVDPIALNPMCALLPEILATEELP